VLEAWLATVEAELATLAGSLLALLVFAASLAAMLAA
jgi:hypothetical protein